MPAFSVGETRLRGGPALCIRLSPLAHYLGPGQARFGATRPADLAPSPVVPRQVGGLLGDPRPQPGLVLDGPQLTAPPSRLEA